MLKFGDLVQNGEIIAIVLEPFATEPWPSKLRLFKLFNCHSGAIIFDVTEYEKDWKIISRYGQISDAIDH